MTKKTDITALPQDLRGEYERAASAIIENAKTEAARIIEEAKASAGKSSPARVRGTQGEEEVTYTFFKDNGEYSDDVFISVNCEKIVCRRGVPVRIKRKFVWAYEQAMSQRERASEKVLERERLFEQRLSDLALGR